MKKAISVLLIIFILLFCGCKGEKTSDDALSDITYTLKQINGTDYMVFNRKPDEVKGDSKVDISFRSLDEMKNAIINDTLTILQKSYIYSNFSKDQHGVYICDLDVLFSPGLPKDMRVEGVDFLGLTYSFKIVSDGEVYGCISLTDEAGLNSALSSDPLYSDGVYMEELEHIDERDATVFIYNANGVRYKRIEYTLENDTGKLIVKEDHTYNSNGEQNNAPDVVYIYGNSNDVFYVAELKGFIKRPDTEWLKNFSMVPHLQ